MISHTLSLISEQYEAARALFAVNQWQSSRGTQISVLECILIRPPQKRTETKIRAIKTNECWYVLKKVGLCTFKEYMEEENIDHGVECDGNVVEKDKMLHEKISELIDENMQHQAELIRRNKENSETIEWLLSQVHKLMDEKNFEDYSGNP